jgi:hypothetical protein
VQPCLPSLGRYWMGIDLPGHRPRVSRGTYAPYAFDSLAPIELDLDDELKWLESQDPVSGSLARVEEPPPRRAATMTELVEITGSSQTAVPSAFGHFIGDATLRTRIRSATDCFLDLADFAVPVESGGFLIHFLADSQWVFHWLLFVGTDSSQAVVASSAPYGFTDENAPHVFSQTAGDACVCAESFSEFLYRFWMENEIFFRLADAGSAQLTGLQRRYLEHYDGR